MAQVGDTLPGGGTLADVGVPSINAAGQAAFVGLIDGADSTDGLFRAGPTGPLAEIGRQGQIAPGGDGTLGTFRSTGVPTLNDAGQVAFFTFVTGTASGTDGRAIYRGDGAGPAVQIVRDGQPAPDGDGTIGTVASSPALNNSGQVAYVGILAGNAGGAADNVGFYRGDGVGPAVQLGREGQAAPDGNGTFSRFSTASLNDAGQGATRGVLTGVSGNPRAAVGLFRGDGAGPLVQLARGGEVAPDGNGTFDAFPANATDMLPINGRGQIAFTANLAGTRGGSTDSAGIFLVDGEAATVQVARTGHPAPGGDGRITGLDLPTLNDAGQVAFIASLAGTAGGSADDFGLYLYDESLGLLQVAREGEAFLGSTLAGVGFAESNGMIADGSGLNGLGQVAYAYALADGRTGVAVFSVDGSVPKPASAGLLCLTAGLLLRRRLTAQTSD